MDQSAGINDAMVAFLEGGVSIVAASCDAARRPSVGRALGCEVSADGRRITIFVDASANAALLAAIADTGKLAVVFTEPSSHRSVQFKGDDAVIGPAGDRCHSVVARHVAAFGRDLARIGYSEVFTRTLMAYDAPDLVAVTFSPVSAFTQTPGPRAGSPLEP